MITRETDKVLIGLAKIETAISRVYEKLSRKPYFRQQVKSFWSELANEEIQSRLAYCPPCSMKEECEGKNPRSG